MSGERFEVIVVGGGPAGATAALTLARAGIRVAIVDEQPALGGQYFKRRHGAVRERYGDYRPAGSALIAALHAAGVPSLTETVVWGAQDTQLFISSLRDGRSGQLEARTVVLATGAHERAVPFPGWTLPGVVTPGCALHLATIDRVAVGRRVLVAGSGPFLLPAACALLEVGAQVVGVLELASPYRYSWPALRAARWPARLLELGGYLARLRRHGVPIRQGWRVHEAHGETRIEGVTIGSASGAREELAVDALCVGYGFRPNAELARLLECRCRIDPASGDPVPVTDRYGRSSRRNVFVIGEARGIAGVHAARTRGLLAAYAIMREAGKEVDAAHRRRALRLAQYHDDFARLTTRIYALPQDLYQQVPDRTIVCRCECVTAADIRAAAADWQDLQAVKASTRAGMGLCQGRQCGNTTAALVAAAGGSPVSVKSAFAPRMPIKPIPFPTVPLEARR